MSELLESYDKEYKTLSESISSKLSQLASNPQPDAKKLFRNQIERDLEEAQEIVGQLEMELVSLPPNVKSQYSARVKGYKEELKKLKRELTNKSGASERDQLLGGSTAIDFEATSTDQRGRLLQGTERLQQGTRRLDEARRIALETEQIGISTLEDLSRQREQITRTRDRLGTADSWIAKSQGVLKNMQRKLAANKMLTTGIIALLVILIIAIIVAKLA